MRKWRKMSKFRVCILASGSKGNATLLQAGDTSILVDAGISARRIKKGLERVGVQPSQLAGIFITHEHRDHIDGLSVFCQYNKIPVFANEETWLAVGFLGKVESRQRRMLPDNMFKVGDISLQSFPVAHDAARPVGFSFFYRDSKCTFATDLGHVDAKVKEAFAGSDTIIVEANHDRQMLKEGKYPHYLKARISGPKGHLSNEDAGALLAEVCSKHTEVFLAHLSKENNCPLLAEKTVRDILQQKGAQERTKIYVANQEEIVSNEQIQAEEITLAWDKGVCQL